MPTPERRRITRVEGQTMLFAAAQDLARQQGRLQEGMRASEDASVMSHSSYALKTKEGQLIARVPLTQARQMLAFRRKLASQLMRKAAVVSQHYGHGAQLDIQKLRIQDEKLRALAWAMSYGRRFPYMGSWRDHTLITLVLLLLGIIPGLVYLFWLWRRSEAYYKLLDQLLSRWRSLGRPDPAQTFFTFDTF